MLAKTKTECAAKLKKLQETCGRKPNEKLCPDMTFGDWLDFWYQNYSKPKLRPKTQLDYENNIYQHIIPALGNIPLNKLTSNDLQQFYAKMKKNGRLNRADVYGEDLSDRMVRACHAQCRTALDRAVKGGLIRVNPAADCKLLAQTADEMQVLTREEMQRFLIQAKEEGDFELFLLELATGLRTIVLPRDHCAGKRHGRENPLCHHRPRLGKDRAEHLHPRHRRHAAGCVAQISGRLWEGRYSPKRPDGKKHSRNIYAHTESECEEKLAKLTQQTKMEIAETKRLAAAGNWDAVMALAGQKKARGARKNEIRA